MGLKPNAAEIAAVLSPKERWRLHHRYRREIAMWEDVIEAGDPLGLAKKMREDGLLAGLRRAMLLTAPRRTA
jgi:hypothetical protein